MDDIAQTGPTAGPQNRWSVQSLSVAPNRSHKDRTADAPIGRVRADHDPTEAHEWDGVLEVEQGPPKDLERLGAHYLAARPRGLRRRDEGGIRGGIVGGRPLYEEGGHPRDAQSAGVCLRREQSIQVLPGLKRPSEVLGIEAHVLSGGPEHLEVSDVTTFREVGREDTAAELRKPGVVTRVLGGQDGRARVGEQRRWGERQSELRTPGAEHVMHWGKVCASVQFV